MGQNMTFSTLARHSSSRRRVLCLGEGMLCLGEDLHLGESKLRFGEPEASLILCHSFASLKQCFEQQVLPS